MRDSDILAVEATRKVEEDVRKVRAKLNSLLRQIDRNLIPHIAGLQAIALAEINHKIASDIQIELARIRSDHNLNPEGKFAQLTLSKSHLASIKKGELCIELRSDGWSDKQIAAAARCKERYVGMLIGHATLLPEIRKMIEAKSVSATLAYETWQGNNYDAIAILETAITEATTDGRYRVTKPDVKAVIRRRKAR